DPAALVADGDQPTDEPAIDSVGTPQAIADLAGGARAAGADPRRARRRDVVRVHQRPGIAAVRAGHRARVLVEVSGHVVAFAVRSEREDDLGDGLGEHAEALLALAQRVLGQL